MKQLNRKLPLLARLVLGGAFLVFGLNGFLGFLPAPPLPDAAGSFVGALAASGYLFPLVKATEVIAGLMLLSNRYAALALVLLAPVVVNIVAFHAFLAPAGLVLPIVLLAAELYLASVYRAAYAPLFRAETAENPRVDAELVERPARAV